MPCWCQRRMGRLVRDDRKATVTQITTRYNQGIQNTISERTTRRTLKQMGYSSRRPHWVPLLSAKNRKQRIQFTQAHQNWTIEDWKNVAWSDESRFLLQHSDSRVKIFHKKQESMDPSCLVSTVKAGGVMVWAIFSWHTLGPLVPIEHRLNATSTWVLLLTMSIPLWLQCTHLLMTTSSRIMSQSSNHLRLVSWTWQWVHFTQMASTVTRSQFNRASLGCGGTGDSHHGCAADKSHQYGPKPLEQDRNRNVSNTLLNLCHEDLRQFWRQKGVQPGTSKVYLIKWPVSVCI